jgi:hypothetical protein
MFIIVLITARDWAVFLTSWVLSTPSPKKHTLPQHRVRVQDIYAGTLSMGWFFIFVSTELSRLLFKFQIIICVLNSKTLYISVSGSRRR